MYALLSAPVNLTVSLLLQTLQVMFWGTISFTPPSFFAFSLVEMGFMLVRVMALRGRYVDTYSPLQLHLACAVIIGMHLLLYVYIFASAYYYRMLTAAVVTLRQYISSYTFHKNPSLHLVCILMPPLVKGLMETASQHEESPSFKREGKAKRLVSAAHQVVRGCL